MHYAPVARPMQLAPHSASAFILGDPESASSPSALSTLLSVLGAGAADVAPGTGAAGPVLRARSGPVKERVIRNIR